MYAERGFALLMNLYALNERVRRAVGSRLYSFSL